MSNLVTDTAQADFNSVVDLIKARVLPTIERNRTEVAEERNVRASIIGGGILQAVRDELEVDLNPNGRDEAGMIQLRQTHALISHLGKECEEGLRRLGVLSSNEMKESDFRKKVFDSLEQEHLDTLNRVCEEVSARVTNAIGEEYALRPDSLFDTLTHQLLSGWDNGPSLGSLVEDGKRWVRSVNGPHGP